MGREIQKLTEEEWSELNNGSKGTSTSPTAVEWLVNEIQSFGIDTKFINNAIEQAKEMEKQQIIDAFDSTRILFAEEYYNETYVSKGSETKQ